MSAVSVTLQEWRNEALEGQELEDKATRKIAEELTQSGKLEILEMRRGLLIRASSYVGTLRLGQLKITVLPKIAETSLLTLLRYAYNLRRLQLFSPLAQAQAPRTFQDLLVLQLASEAAELISRGLHRRYEPVHEDLPSPRGKIDFQKLLRQGGLNQARLPCRHHPRLENTLENQFLLAGLMLGTKITKDLHLKTLLRRLASLMQDTVEPIRLDGESVRRVRRAENRMTRAYRPARSIIELLLDGLGITLDSRLPSTPAPGFLFDMNRFFQELLSTFLNDNLEGLTVVDEFRLKGMMVYDPLHNPLQHTPPVLRPDYVILDRYKPVAILDAKYRDLWEMPLPRDMLYQLVIYALSRFAGVNFAVILFPTVEPTAREARIQIMDPLKGQSRAQVILRPVNLLNLEELIAQPQGMRRTKKCQEFAHYLVFGNA